MDKGVTASPPLCGPTGGAGKPSPAEPAVANASAWHACGICWGVGTVDAYRGPRSKIACIYCGGSGTVGLKSNEEKDG